VVALGAAVQADLLAGEGNPDDVLLLDVLPLSLGLVTMGGVVEKILPRNTTIPAGARQTFTTYADRQTGFDLHVVQGERELEADCRSLARFVLKGIPPLPAGMARLDVTFRVDADGLLSVEARETTTGVEQTIEVHPSYGLTDEEVEAMLMAAIDHGEEDLARRRLVEERIEAERVLAATSKALAVDADLLEGDERAGIETAMAELEGAVAGDRPAVVHARIEMLDDATKAWAGRRMDRAVARAIAGKAVDAIEGEVAQARGVDAHVEEHAARRSGGV
jgi:molecular chaperone HscA